MIRYINKVLQINEKNYKEIIEKCNEDLINDYKNVCSVNYGDPSKPSVFRDNKKLPVSTENGFYALSYIAVKLSQLESGRARIIG